MKKLSYLLLFFYSVSYSQQIAITIDDFPFRRMGLPVEEEAKMINQLYDHLDRFNIKATGFINSYRINSENEPSLKDFLDRGHDFGNHTHRHSNIDVVGAQLFIADIDSGWTQGKSFINTRFFRYPYLRRGNTLERRDSVFMHLEAQEYIIAHVSVDNNEWIYNRDYVKARQNNQIQKMETIAEEYLDHMKNISLEYEEKGNKLTGRSVKHILLIHANPINAVYLGELLQWYQNEGWEFITLEEALSDPIYSQKDSFASPYGWSQIDRLIKSAKDQASVPADK